MQERIQETIPSKKIVIVGAGYAGLALGALLSKTGHHVTLYEAHTYVGGCASYFKRKKFKFDAGATTLSGLGTDRPLHRLLKLLNLSLDVRTLQEPMKITLNNGVSFLRHADLEKHIETMEELFPGLDHHRFWHQLKKREEDLWSVLAAGQYFPPKNLRDLKNLIQPELIKRSPLGLWAFTPFIKTVPKKMQKNPAFMDFINEQLIISTQGHADTVPALLAAMGLIYPDDMYYTDGGMVTLAESLAQTIKDNGGEVHLRRPVKEISKKGDKFFLTIKGPGDKTLEDHGDMVISNLTVWDTPKILEKKLKDLYPTHKRRGAWGAATAYFAIKAKEPVTPLYHQVHYHDSWLGKGSFFYSLAHPKDQNRGPEGWQTVTVSTHSEPRLWQDYFQEKNYDEFKRRFAQVVQNHFSAVSMSESIIEMTDIEVGTPHTFERFTRRHQGLVGGLPHNLKNNILTFPSQETPIENFYQIGDTTFPGQGVVGVVTGALILAGKINNTNYLK